jgi:hypothetical protein
VLKKVRVILTLIIAGMLLTGCASEAPSVSVNEPKQQEIEQTAQVKKPTPLPTEAPTEVPAVQIEIPYSHTDVVKRKYSTSHQFFGIVEITNTGSGNLFLFDSSLEFVDPTGTFIVNGIIAVPCPNVVQPGESSYLYAFADFDGDFTEPVSLMPHGGIIESPYDCIRLPVSEPKLTRNTDVLGFEVTVYVENDTGSDVSNIMVGSVLKNIDGNPVCVACELVDEIKAGDKIMVSMNSVFTDWIVEDSIAKIDAYAFPW